MRSGTETFTYEITTQTRYCDTGDGPRSAELAPWRAFTMAVAAVALLSLPAQAQNRYVGVKACAPCHGAQHATDKAEDPLGIWQGSGHAGAYRTLAEKEARQVEGLWIVKMGRGDKYGLPVPAAEFPHCLVCHSTAVGVDPQLVAPSLDRKDGVQCEACHGPSSAHVQAETLKRSGKAIPPTEIAAAFEVARAVSFKRYANDKEIEARCRTCHDGMCGPFDFAAMWPKIKHAAPVRR